MISSKMRQPWKVIWVSVLAGILYFAPTPLHAAVTTVGAVPNAPPAGGGAVVGTFTIGDSAFGSVAVAGGTAITNTGSATLGNGVAGIGVMTLSGFGSDWTVNTSTSDIMLGDEGAGQITVSNQARITTPDDSFIGVQDSSTGKLIVTGLGSVYDNADDFTVGVSGQAAVDITSGGAIESDVVIVGDNSTATGVATVSGDLSRWTASLLTIGDAGGGTFNVEDAGRLSATGQIILGQIAGSSGVMDVSGVGTLVSGAGLVVAAAGSGSVTIRDGAQFVSSAAVNVAQSAGSAGELTVTGTGSRLTSAGAISTNAGEGKIVVADGGVISAATGFVVNATGRIELAGGRLETTQAANTAVNVLGTLIGSGTLTAQGVTVASSPRGRLATAAGDRLRVTGLVVNNGLVDLDGGELEIAGVMTNNNSADIDARNGAILRVGGTGLDNNNGSQLSITGGQVDVFGAVDNNLGATIAVVGGATGVFHDAVANSGTIFVSASSEIVMLENLNFVPNAALSVQLASILPDQEPTEAFGAVNIGGAAALNGALSVTLASGFTPKLGETYQVLHAGGGRSGSFSSESLPNLGSGKTLDVQYTSDAVILAVVPSLFGDYSGNGVVDAADYTEWRDSLGAAVPSFSGADGSGNGIVDQADFDVWKTNFGASAGSGSVAASSQPVPEPAAILLAVLAIVAGSYERRVR